MLYKNLLVSVIIFFGWLGVDAIMSLAGNPLDGVHYPMQSHRLRSNVYSDQNWADKTSFVAPFFLAAFGLLWWYLVRREGRVNGARVAAIITAFAMLSFWVVPAVSADMHDLKLNGYWLASMIYCNVSFFLFGFLGRATENDLYF